MMTQKASYTIKKHTQKRIETHIQEKKVSDKFIELNVTENMEFL